MEIIKSKKVDLIRWLRGDKMILQYVDQNKILTTDEYNTIKHTADPSNQITELVDMILNKGDSTCIEFLRLLAKDDVNETRPMLRKWISGIMQHISDKLKAQIKKATKPKTGAASTLKGGKINQDKPKAPAKKAAKRKADEEEKKNQGVENDTSPKKRRKADPDKLKAQIKKATKPKTGAASTLKGGKINQGKPKASTKKADQPKADKPKTPKKAAKPKTDKPKTSTKKTTNPKADVTEHAKPSKKCVKGYIHNVSKVVLSASKRKYFTALLQQAKTCSKLVVFKTEHHQEYVKAENNRSPVKLENIKYEDQRRGEKDIIAGWDSKLSFLTKLPFSFDATKKQETNSEHKTIRAIKNCIDNQRVHVTVRINKKLKSGAKMIRAKETHDMTVYKVSDKSGSLDLTVWKKKNLSVGKWYLLRNVSVKKFQGKTELSTTPQTTFKEVAEPGAPAESVSLTDATNKSFKEVGTGTGGEHENNMA